MSDILNDFVNGSNSSNSLFTSDLYPQSNFQPRVGCNQINSNNGIHSLLEKSSFPHINEQNLSDNGKKDNTGIQYSNAVSVGRPYGKHSLFKKYDYYFSCEFLFYFILFFLINYLFIYFIIYYNLMYCVFLYYLMSLLMFRYNII